MSKVGIVIVNYNGERFQNDCIRTLYEMNFQDFIIVVVDSGSTDHSIKKLKESYPNVYVLEQKSNVGVAVGNNIGIKFVKSIGTEYILLLNNDTEVDKNLLRELLSSANKNIVTVPKIYFYDNKKMLWFAGGGMIWNKAVSYHEGIYKKDFGQYDSDKIIEYAPTCCMLIHSSIFDRIGYIDEKIFMYYDDTDLCVRLNDAGVKIKYIPNAFMWHKVSSSSGGMQSKIGIYYTKRNQLYFIDKYKNRIKKIDRMVIILKNLVKAILSPIRNKNEKYIITAYKDYYRGVMGRKDF